MASTEATPDRPMVRSSSARTFATTSRTPAAPARAGSVHPRPSDGDGVGAQGHGLEDVGPGAHAAVEDERRPRADRLAHEGGVQRGECSIDLPAAVVGDHDAADPEPHCPDRVVRVHDPLEQDGEPGPLAQRGEMLPRQARVGVDVEEGLDRGAGHGERRLSRRRPGCSRMIDSRDRTAVGVILAAGRPPVRGAASRSATTCWKRGSEVYCAMPMPQENGRLPRLRSCGRHPSICRVEGDDEGVRADGLRVG